MNNLAEKLREIRESGEQVLICEERETSGSDEIGDIICDLSIKATRADGGICVSASCGFSGSGKDRIAVLTAIMKSMHIPAGFEGFMELMQAHSQLEESQTDEESEEVE